MDFDPLKWHKQPFPSCEDGTLAILEAALQRWRALPHLKVFGPADPNSSPQLSQEQPLYQKALRETYGHSQLLPIESLKFDAEFWLRTQNEHEARIFLSSGTTQSERSVSPFSPAGLALYREFSLKAFWAVMQHFFEDPRAVAGWSFIPKPSEWPHSSLAQMVAWIGEESNLHYVNGELPVIEKPIWFFATAFHLVQFADSGQRWPLPEGSVVIETGGTKGKSRSVSRQELYDLIGTHFGVPEERIVSEYGMCEMASQAYDFVTSGSPKNLSERRFQFPSWVHVKAIDGLGQTMNEGAGSLLVHDPLRIDLPWPLRTEDMVKLEAGGRFQLLGRVPYAPLKGCSLLAEDVMNQTAQKPPAHDAPPYQLAPLSELERRAQKVSERWQSWLREPLLAELFGEELGNSMLARDALHDLALSIPPDPKAWLQAALNAVGPDSPERWLIIPPRTHSLAPLQALGLASVLDLKVLLRGSNERSVYSFFQSYFTDLMRLELLPSTFRLGLDLWPEVDAALVFGSSETLAELRAICPWPIQGFGTHLTASFVHETEVETKASLLWRDALSLGQRGCMSSRIAFVWGARGSLSVEATASLEAASRRYFDALSLPDSLSLVHASYQWRREKRLLWRRHHPAQPLLIFEAWSAERDLAHFICDRPWALPVIHVRAEDSAAFKIWLERETDLERYSLSDRSQAEFRLMGSSTCELGQANAPQWTGFHQGRPLYAIAR